MRPDEQQQRRRPRARPSRRRAAARGPGENTSRSTPGGTTADPVGVGVVEADELAALLVGVGDQPVGGVDDLGLADGPRGRLRVVAGGQREVLDLGHRVHGVDQRHVPPLGGQPGRPGRRASSGSAPGRTSRAAGRPRARISPEVKAHSWAGRSSLARPSKGPAVTCRTVTPGASSTRRRQVRAGGPGDHVDLDVERRQAAGELDDVDVHAAGVAGARLVERRRVHADHGQPSRHAAARRHHRHRHLVTPP